MIFKPDAISSSDLPDAPAQRQAGHKSIMIIAGEVSGDMHAADVVRAVQRRLPNVEFYGIGGERMRNVGVDTLYDTDDMAVMGVTEVLRRFRFFKTVFYEMVDLAFRRKPDAAFLVDYPGFNLRLAAKLHAMGIKVIYYICPQVWAWNRSRIPRVAEVVDKLITIFPFEARHFAGTDLDVEFAGHPLVDEANALLAKPPAELPWGDRPGVALLPGSRVHEIGRLLPVMWKAAALLDRQSPGLDFIIATPSDRETGLIGKMIAGFSGGPTRYHVVPGKTREVLRQARAAMVASGTATIETALMSCPMVITYKLAPLTHLLAKLLVRVEYAGMVNIVAGKEICPEFLQYRATPTALTRAITPLINDTPERKRMLEELRAVVATLGSGGAAEHAAGMLVRTAFRTSEDRE